jgi:hypothetical protein
MASGLRTKTELYGVLKEYSSSVSEYVTGPWFNTAQFEVMSSWDSAESVRPASAFQSRVTETERQNLVITVMGWYCTKCTMQLQPFSDLLCSPSVF